MAKKNFTDKGFKIIELDEVDCIKAGFGPICDNCNEIMNLGEPRYYVPVLNRLFCKECYNAWYENATYYEEDKDYESRYFNYYCKLLNIKEDDKS